MARRNPIEQALARELDDRRVPYWIDHSRPHVVVHFESHSKRMQLFFPKTPSCSRALVNSLTTLRRMLRQAETAASEAATARHD